MCEFCAEHGAGKRWYHNARNASKNLATSDFVREFCEIYFSSEVQLGSQPIYRPPPQESLDSERQRVDHYYRNYLHHQVITTDEALQLLRMASYQTDEHERAVVRIPCIFRYAGYGADSNLHCYGIAFTDMYTHRFPRYLGGNHDYVSAASALDLLKEMIEDELIVHAISALGVPYLGMLCNCEMNVCRPYLHRVHLGINIPFHKGHFVANIDGDKCLGCSTCESVCPFGIPKLVKTESLSSIDLEACFGCGVCVRNCPEEAISLAEASGIAGY